MANKSNRPATEPSNEKELRDTSSLSHLSIFNVDNLNFRLVAVTNNFNRCH